MVDASFFTHPRLDWQRRYEALRASFVERLPAHIVADRFGYTTSYIHFLRHQFKHGKLDFAEASAEGTNRRRRVSVQVRQKIRAWRERRLSAAEITELLLEDGVEISVRTVERVLAEEGFAKLPRRTRLKIGQSVQGAEMPDKSHKMVADELDGRRFDSPAAGVFLFAPFLAQLRFPAIVEAARLPGSRQIPSLSYLLSFLALKLLGTERYAHVGEHGFDPPLGPFAGLNVLPKCTAMSSCDANKLFRHFVKGKGTIEVRDGHVTVTFPRRAHNPILRSVPWKNFPNSLPASHDTALRLRLS